ncbi:YlxM family DNA-binding protein [Peptoniphilus sp. oral taxon 386]|uniref:YlxM family DNA-binding protein n=1 Tax=Peptoniphilus sp. oral taxon 386 TaxID=652713 RepID=UPI0002E9855D|nr:sigma factor-like helix-turn-helix DNA-binding protein [Peptoniphilus sp. oral taxon 386]
MIDKVIEINTLLDFYGKLLSEKQERAITMYYIYDCSINEIAEELCISKQAVSDNIKRAEQKLIDYEKKLDLVKSYEERLNKLALLRDLFSEFKNNSKSVDDITLRKIYSTIFDKEEVY